MINSSQCLSCIMIGEETISRRYKSDKTINIKCKILRDTQLTFLGMVVLPSY